MNPLNLSRSSTIYPELLGKIVEIHNGKEYKSIGPITIDDIGKKLGEFSITKIPAIYKRNKKK